MNSPCIYAKYTSMFIWIHQQCIENIPYLTTFSSFFISHTTTTTYNWYNEIILWLRTLNHIANLLSFLGVCSSVCEGHGGARKVSNDYNCLLPRCYGIHSYVWRHKWRILQQRPWLVSVCVSSPHSLPYVFRLQKAWLYEFCRIRERNQVLYLVK